jgi:hypothetical protein
MESNPSITTRWKPGQSGNPAGRRAGAKNRFSAEFVDTLAANFAEHGADVIDRVRRQDPAAYLRICAQLVPKEFLLAVEDQRAALSGDEWTLIIPVLKAVREALPDANQREPAEVLQFVLNALNAASAKVIEPDCSSGDSIQAIEKEG